MITNTLKNIDEILSVHGACAMSEMLNSIDELTVNTRSGSTYETPAVGFDKEGLLCVVESCDMTRLEIGIWPWNEIETVKKNGKLLTRKDLEKLFPLQTKSG